MKKKRVFILILVIFLLLIPIGKSVWDELLSNIIPWTRTSFSEIEVDFLDNVMQEPENIQDYYCLVIIKNGPCYTGVIANDTTHEMIEFSVEIPR